MAEHIYIPTFDEIRKVLDGTKWEYEGPLPAWMARHGKINGKQFNYSQQHFFTGYAKVLNREVAQDIDYVWNDQLIPWPWYLGVSQLPEDPQILIGLEDNPELQKKYMWLSYADEHGMWSGRYPISKREELSDKFTEITDKYLPKTPQKPNITLPHGDLETDDLKIIYSEKIGTILRPIVPKR
jgi:hypothetical protein